MNYFELYGIPINLKVNTKLIKPLFYELSRKYHPDFHSNDAEEKQSDMLEKSSLVNKAFKVFNNPDELIKYVLQLKGLLEEEEKYVLPPAFLMGIMELNEQLEDAGLIPDKNTDIGRSSDEAEITVQVNIGKENVKSIISNFQNEIYEPVKQIVEHYQEGITTEKELLQVKEYYYKKKYLSRILAGMY